MNSCRKLLPLLLMATCLLSAIAAPPDSAPPQAAWDKVKAAQYLDDRMDLWFVKAKKLRTGQETASCVSCHTVVPYVLARPSLRKATGAKQPTPQEARLLKETLRRVDTYGDHEPFYKGKAEQSRGTEAVLNLLILAEAATAQNSQTLVEPTRQALAELWKEQREDGAWDWLDFENEPYESADSVYYGAALAAMAVGTTTGYESNSASMGLDKLRSYLKLNYPAQNLYNKTWMLLASVRLPGLLSREQMDALAAELQRHQNADGGWSLYQLGPWSWSKASPPYSPGGKPDFALLSNSDAYATGLVVYALRQAGWPASHAALKRATDWLQADQKEVQIEQNHWQCWRGYSLNYDREHGGDTGEPWRRMFMSDAATAFAALALSGAK